MRRCRCCGCRMSIRCWTPAYAPYDVGVMGELDVRIMAELFGGREMAEALTPAWEGGIYYAAQRAVGDGGGEGERRDRWRLFYLSRWKNEDSARSFARMYVEAGRRGSTPRSSEHKKDEKDDDEEIYTTSEGDVLIARTDTEVFVSEGFELPLARKLQEMVEGAQASGPVQSASRRDGRAGVRAGAGVARVGNDA